MVKIREEQMQAFREYALRNFEDAMVEHLQGFAPTYCEVMGDLALRQVIRSGVARAQGYGLTERGPVQFFIELLLLLGIDFDTDPQLSWVRETLNNSNLPDQIARSGLLYDRTMDYINAVGGKNHAHIQDALRRLALLRFEDLPESQTNFGYVVLGGLQDFYPQKCQYLGETPLRALITLGTRQSAEYGLTTYQGKTLYIAMMFAFGYRFDHDPRVPWAKEILKNPDLQTPTEKAKGLYLGMMKYFRLMLAHLEDRERLCA